MLTSPFTAGLFQFPVKLGQTGRFGPQLLLLGEGPLRLLLGVFQLAFQSGQAGFVPLQIFGHGLQSVVDPGHVAHRVVGQLRRIGQVLFHRHLKLGAVAMELHGETPVLAQVKRFLRVAHEHTRLDDGLARRLALGEHLPHDGHGESVLFDRMGLHDGQVLSQRLNEQPGFSHLLGVVFQRLILHLILHGGVVGLQHFQLRHLHVQVHLFPNPVVPGGKSLDLGVGQGGGVHILGGPGGGFAGHNLTDEFLLVLHQPPVIGVKGALGDILVHPHLLIHVTYCGFGVGGAPFAHSGASASLECRSGASRWSRETS